MNFKFNNNDSKNLPKKIQTNVALDRLELLNKKIINRVNLNLSCEDGICKSGFLNGNISKQKNIAFKIQKNLKNEKIEAPTTFPICKKSFFQKKEIKYSYNIFRIKFFVEKLIIAF